MQGAIGIGDFVVDPAEGRLLRGNKEILIRPKAFAVLCALARRLETVVSREDLIAAAWPETTVSDWSLSTAIFEIRTALGDSGRHPRYLQTVHRRGFRLVSPPVCTCTSPCDCNSPRGNPAAPRANQVGGCPLVGREAEIATLSRALAETTDGPPRVVLIGGEPGTGKTALLDHLANLAKERNGATWILRGQSYEHHSTMEPYMAILEALGGVASGPRQATLLPLLRRCAPTWLAQMPWLGDAAQPAAITAQRMPRELAALIDALSRQGPVLLLLDDLQWASVETLEALCMLARRPGAAHLLVAAAFQANSPQREAGAQLIDRLCMLRNCRELTPSPLTLPATDALLRSRLGGAEPPDGLAATLLAWSRGNPLFLHTLLDAVLAGREVDSKADKESLRSAIAKLENGTPPTLRRIVERQIECLPQAKQRWLTAASAVGLEFDAAAIADAAEIDEATESLDRLAHLHRFLRKCPPSAQPDGATRFSFAHSTYREVLYQRIAPADRRRLHAEIAQRLASLPSERTGSNPTTIAFHYRRAGDSQTAARHYAGAARAAIKRLALHEALANLSAALEQLQLCAPKRENRAQVLALTLWRAHLHSSIAGFSPAAVREDFLAAEQLATELGDDKRRFGAIYGLAWSSFSQGRVDAAASHSRQLHALATELDDPVYRVTAAGLHSWVLLARGEIERATAAVSGPLPDGPSLRPQLGIDFEIGRLWVLGVAQAVRGSFAESHRICTAMIERGRELGHSHGLAYAYSFASVISAFAGDAEAADRHSAALLHNALRNDFPVLADLANVVSAWSRVARNDALPSLLEGALLHYAEQGRVMLRTSFDALFAEQHLRRGRTAEAEKVIDAALAASRDRGELLHLAELHRLRGEILRERLAKSGHGSLADSEQAAQVERELRQAAGIARRQGTRLFELRACTCLATFARQNRADTTPSLRLLRQARQRFAPGETHPEIESVDVLLAPDTGAAS